jgi:hypothetical protein
MRASTFNFLGTADAAAQCLPEIFGDSGSNSPTARLLGSHQSFV